MDVRKKSCGRVRAVVRAARRGRRRRVPEHHCADEDELRGHAHARRPRAPHESSSLLKDAETGQRGFVITGDEAYLEPYRGAVDALPGTLEDLRELTADNPNQQQAARRARAARDPKLAELKRTIDLRRTRVRARPQMVVRAGEGKKTMDDAAPRPRPRWIARSASCSRSAPKRSTRPPAGARSTILVGTLLCLLLVHGAGVVITRSLTTQIGSAVQHVQSSSAELQAAANQQATGAKEQATAMSEITTTISELLATSRQIAESAQRVAQIAGETAVGGPDAATRRWQDARTRSGRITAAGRPDRRPHARAREEVAADRRHPRDHQRARRADQHPRHQRHHRGGRRRRGGQALRRRRRRDPQARRPRRGARPRRSAVSSTTSAPPSTRRSWRPRAASKAVDAGTRQFGDVATSFKQIAGLVATTTEAAQGDRAQHQAADDRGRAGQRRDRRTSRRPRRRPRRARARRSRPRRSSRPLSRNLAHSSSRRSTRSPMARGPVQILPGRGARARRWAQRSGVLELEKGVGGAEQRRRHVAASRTRSRARRGWSKRRRSPSRPTRSRTLLEPPRHASAGGLSADQVDRLLHLLDDMAARLAALEPPRPRRPNAGARTAPESRPDRASRSTRWTRCSTALTEAARRGSPRSCGAIARRARRALVESSPDGAD